MSRRTVLASTILLAAVVLALVAMVGGTPNFDPTVRADGRTIGTGAEVF